ncbi:MAG TPA: hypothetical protein VHB46_15915 [Burkholderiales bacterium]|nr:hypothetical protein [Burkholderiales bacterium]
MSDDKLSRQRRSFLEGVIATAAAAGVAAVAPGIEAAAAAETPGEFSKWLAGIKGKHRQVYDMPEVNGGMGLAWSWVLKLTGAQAYGVSEDDIGVVVVLRHNAIPLAFQDAMWEKYPLGEYFRIEERGSNAPATRNPYSNLKPGEWVPDAAIDKLVAKGVKVAVCNFAVTHYSGEIAKKTGATAQQVKDDWLANVIPGVAIVPSGVVALNGAQAKGCAYVAAG